MSGASFENPHGEVAILAGNRAESLGTSALYCSVGNPAPRPKSRSLNLSKEPPEIRGRFCELPAKLNL
jgi:hypothetical protein